MANPVDLSKLSPEELLAEATRLQGENKSLGSEAQSLKDRLNSASGNLRAQLNEARAELAKVQGHVAEQEGPEEGTLVCFQRGAEPFHRPARVLSKGWTARVPTNEGMRLHAYIEVGEPPHALYKDGDGNYFTPGHTFETDRAYNTMSAPDTFHHPEDCPHKGDPKKAAFKEGKLPAFMAEPQAP